MDIAAIASNGYPTQIDDIYSRITSQQNGEQKKQGVHPWGEDTVVFSVDAEKLMAQMKEPAPDLPQVMLKINGLFYNLSKGLGNIGDADKSLDVLNGLSHTSSEKDFIKAISDLTGASVEDVKKAFDSMSAKEAAEFAKQMGEWMKVDPEEYLKNLTALCDLSDFAMKKELANERSNDKTIMGLLDARGGEEEEA